MTSSAAYRIAFTYSAAFALAIVLLGVTVYLAAHFEFRTQLDAHLADESAELVQSYHGSDIASLRAVIMRRQSSAISRNFGYALFDRSNGRRTWGSLATPMPEAGFHDITFTDPDEGADDARALGTDLPGGLRLVVALDPEELESLDAIILGLFSVAFVLILLLGAVGTLVLGGYLRRRFSRITGTASAIVSGDLNRRVPVSQRGDEFDELARALNTMLDRIAELMGNLRQISSDVAHDLRTPLARLHNQLEQALHGASEPQLYRDALKQALAQSDHLLALFAAILRISEVEAGALQRTFLRVDVSDIACDLGESYAPAVADGGRTLHCAIAPRLAVNGDRELLAQALINLLDNAQRHTPRGTNILLAVAADGSDVVLTVADDGLGVAPEDRERITRRFVRLDASRNTAGHGLGLSLLSAIVAAHGGALAITGNGPGLRVTITLPRMAP